MLSSSVYRFFSRIGGLTSKLAEGTRTTEILRRDWYPTVAQIQAALNRLDSQDHAVVADEEEPIFLLANGWRTGSTLLQRVLMTDSKLLMWGESLGQMGLLSRLSEAVAAVNSKYPDPTQAFVLDFPVAKLSTSWVADLYPPTRHLRLAFRDLFQTWLANPARERGYQRWGFKEVRLGAPEAVFLRWLYPKARFIVLLRDPFSSFLSCRYWNMYDRFPDRRMNSVGSYARIWNRLALSWSDLPADFDHLVLFYEDIAAGNCDFRQLEEFCGLTLDENVALKAKVGGSKPVRPLSRIDRWVISRLAGPGMRAHGYGG